MSPNTCIPSKLALLLLTCTLLMAAACDKKTTPKPQNLDQSQQESQATTPPPSTNATTRIANDVHTHLSPLSYPAAIKLMDENGLHRVVNMSGGHGLEYMTHNLQAADQSKDRIALF